MSRERKKAFVYCALRRAFFDARAEFARFQVYPVEGCKMNHTLSTVATGENIAKLECILDAEGSSWVQTFCPKLFPSISGSNLLRTAPLKNERRAREPQVKIDATFSVVFRASERVCTSSKERKKG